MGLRISELSNLKIANIGEQWCRVLGKGKKERDIPMLPEVYALFKQVQACSMNREYVFELRGEKLSENSLRYTLTKAFAEVGLRVNASSAQTCLRNGVVKQWGSNCRC